MFGRKKKQAVEVDHTSIMELVVSAVKQACVCACSVTSYGYTPEVGGASIRLHIVADEKKNPNRTKEGLAICECCGVVYKPVHGDGLWPNVTKIQVHGLWPEGGRYKRPDNELLLKAVNSDRFCPHCEEDLQNTLDTLRYVSSKETEDSDLCAALRRGIYEEKTAAKEEGDA